MGRIRENSLLLVRISFALAVMVAFILTCVMIHYYFTPGQAEHRQDEVEVLQKIVDSHERQINLLIENDLKYYQILQLLKKRIEALEEEKKSKKTQNSKLFT